MHDARAWVICSTFASLIREVVLGLAAGLLSIITLVGCAGDKKKKTWEISHRTSCMRVICCES